MCCHTRLSDHVHLFCAHLKFHIGAGGANQGGVERLVAVEFGNGNQVFEFPWQRLVELVQDAERCVAIDH